LLKNGVPAYWWRGNFNFGDLVTPLLIKYYGFSPIPASPQTAKLVAAGSILEQLPNDYEGIILGSGFIGQGPTRLFPKADLLTVRGKLTREKLGRGDEVRLGDPGLLTSIVFPERKRKIYRLGVIPHYVDHKNEKFLNLKNKYAPDPRVLFIDVMEYPEKVIGLIDQCEYIISSTLHGLIVADSLGIPNAWIESKDMVGGRFKFDDYYSSLDLNEVPIKFKGNESIQGLISSCSLKPQDEISRLKFGLDDIWRNLSFAIAS
jgi:pyruvyltransferase